MPDAKLKTHSPALDYDLSILFEAEKEGRLPAIKKATWNPETSIEDLLVLVRHEILRLALALLDDKSYSDLQENCPEGAREHLRHAHQLAEQYLGHLPNHPAVLAKLKEERERPEGVVSKPSESQPLPLDLNVVARIAPMPMLIGDEKNNYLPALRIGFLDKRDKILLDSTMDWDDALFIAEGMLKALHRHMDQCLNITAETLSLPTDKLKEKILGISHFLHEIRRMAEHYGFDPDSASPDQQDKGDDAKTSSTVE